ncbi:MAG: DUF4156 domain-containing protein [Myxococcales bacterium]|nr:DUF4156 domain-containing protein [Myxococcales bacterium]
MQRKQRLGIGSRVGGRRRGATWRRRWVLGAGLLLCGCSTEYLPVALTPDGEHVVVAETDPPATCDEIGPLEGKHGTQCNAFGRTGTRDGAMIVLRNAAGSRGANYVRIDREIAPDVPHDNCLYTLRATAFRCP